MILYAACGSVVLLHATSVFDYIVVIEIAFMDNQGEITETTRFRKGKLFFGFILLFTSSWPCRKDQFAVSYFSTSLIVLIQVYKWEIGHHSLVCCCALADILYIARF